MAIDEEFKAFIELDSLKEKNRELEAILEKCLPYVIFHYERSAVGLGKEHLNLINKIRTLLKI